MQTQWRFDQKWIIGLLAAVLLSGLASPAQTQDEKEVILALSMTLQGNGLNWPSTTGAVSEMLHSAAVEAREIQDREGRPVRIDITSVAGASSGSATAVLLDAILRNPTVVKQTGTAGKSEITINEAERAAEMMRFISLSLDLSTSETLKLIGGAAYEKSKAAVKNVAANLARKSSFFKMLNKVEKPVWSPVLNGRDAVADFGRYIHFARTADFRVIKQKLSQFPILQNMVNMALADRDLAPLVEKLNYIYDVPEVNAALLQDRAEKEVWFINSTVRVLREAWLSKYTERRRKILKGIINQSLLATSKKSSRDLERDAVDMTPATINPANVDNPFAATFSEQLNAGFMTLSMVQEFASDKIFEDTIRETGKIDYESLRPYVFMDRATAEEIVASSTYREALKDPSLRLERFVIVAIENAYSAMNPSIVEPGLLTELTGRLTDRKFGVTAVYDPRLDGSHTYQLLPVSDQSLNGRRLFVVGGFPMASIIAQLQALLHLAHIASLEQAGHIVYGRAHIFAKQVQWLKDGMFATHLLRQTLNTGDEARGLAQVADWFEWMRIFYDRDVPRMNTGRNAVIETWTNWDLSPLPGAVLRISDIQVAKAINAVREAWRLVESKLLPASAVELTAHDRRPKSGTPPEGWAPRPPGRCEELFLSR